MGDIYYEWITGKKEEKRMTNKENMKPKSDFVESVINDLKECKQYIMFTSHVSENQQRRLTAINNAIMLLSGIYNID